jgi:hypothetical protein
MTILVQNTEVSSTFDYWRTRTNELARSMSTAAITTDGVLGAASVNAVGNAAITGTFAANVLVTNTLNVITSIEVGNSTVNAVINSTSMVISNSVNHIEIDIPTTTQVSNGQYFLNANSQWSIVPLAIGSGSVVTSGTSGTLIDTFPLTSNNGADYLISTKDTSANGYAITHVLVFHDGGYAYATEYATMFSNATSGALATFTTTISGTDVQLWANPTRSSTLIKFTRILV